MALRGLAAQTFEPFSALFGCLDCKASCAASSLTWGLLCCWFEAHFSFLRPESTGHCSMMLHESTVWRGFVLVSIASYSPWPFHIWSTVVRWFLFFVFFLLLGFCKGCFILKTDRTSCLTSCRLDVLIHWNSATSWDTFFYHSSKHYECSPLWWMHLKSWFSLHPNAHWPNMWVKANLLLTTAGTQTETAIQMSCRLVCHESEPSLGPS